VRLIEKYWRGKRDNSGEWLVVRICLYHSGKKARGSNGHREREINQKQALPSPPLLWGGAWFGSKMAASDF
jgi:hypothetical protein